MMRPRFSAALIAGVLLSTLLAGCTTDPPLGKPDADTVTMRTNLGCLVIELYGDEAPITVANFLRYVDEDFYEDVAFHRVVAGFVIQGGGFTRDGEKKDTHAGIQLEAKLPNSRGTLSMARTSDPNSGTSQFFVNLVDNAALDPSSSSPGYAVFGKVTQGMDIVDAIGKMPTKASPGGRAGGEWPQGDPYITSADRGQDCTPPPPPTPTYGLTGGLMTSARDAEGAWTVLVSGQSDGVPAWLRNNGNQNDAFNVQIEGPAHWNVDIDPARIELGPAGERVNRQYTNVTPLVMTFEYDVSKGTAAPTDRVTFTFTSEGDPDTSTTLVVAPTLASNHPVQVSQIGDTVAIAYRGFFDSGDTFDEGTLPPESQPDFAPVVGGTGLVPGFSYGMLGLALHESTTLRFPPELGYGHDNPEGSPFARFNGEWLNFDIEMTELPS